MARFDAELYLRLVGEEMLIDPRQQEHAPWGSTLTQSARALVAVEAISPSEAETVIADYSVAQALRDEHWPHRGLAMRHASHPGQGQVHALPSPRVVPCDAVIENAQGTTRIRHVVLAQEATTIAVTWRPDPSLTPSRRHRRAMMFMTGPGGRGGPPMPRVVDDQGTSARTHFSGGGHEEEWRGQLRTDRPLSPDTAWIEIDGRRIDLTDKPRRFEVAIEPLPEQTTAYRYLWQRVAVPDRFHTSPGMLEPAIDALVAAGALDPGDPVLAEVRAVLEAMAHHPGMHTSGAHGARQLPQPWRSLLSRAGQQDGPEETIAIGAVTPVFDGFTVALFSLESQPDGFTVEVQTSPGVEHHGPFPAGVQPRQLAWWAADDRANHYLGQMGRWSGGGDHSEGDISFWPALHPKARRLDVMPTGETQRAILKLPLPWAAAKDQT